MPDLPHLLTCLSALPLSVPGLVFVAMGTPSVAPTAGRLALQER